MAKPLSAAEVERIAALAHLELTPAEVKLFAAQLGEILEYAERLKTVDTASTAATWHPGAPPPGLRPDVEQPALPREDALAAAPERGPDGLFRVPQVLD